MIYAIKLAMSSYKFPCAKKYSTHIIWAEIDTFNPASDCSAHHEFLLRNGIGKTYLWKKYILLYECRKNQGKKNF